VTLSQPDESPFETAPCGCVFDVPRGAHIFTCLTCRESKQPWVVRPGWRMKVSVLRMNGKVMWEKKNA
jgi:hypothetical protein